MIQLLIIADDFTGALDTGVQLTSCGIKTCVVVSRKVDFKALNPDVAVLVIDAETRHIPAETAYKIVAEIVKQAKKERVGYIFKKTDSALRGNVGAELTAVLKSSKEEQLPFLPAFPQMGRVTKNGIQYIDGIPVAKSIFGADPFEPDKYSDITKIIGAQSDVLVKCLPPLTEDSEFPPDAGILVFDSSTLEDMIETGKRLFTLNKLKIMAGCAGFGAILPRILHIERAERPSLPKLDPKLLVICGSVNPITIAQTEYAEKKGFVHLRLTPQEKLAPDYWMTEEGKKRAADIRRCIENHPFCIIDANGEEGNDATEEYAKKHGIAAKEIRVKVARAIGCLVKELFTAFPVENLLITGGDTLLQCMHRIDVNMMEPVCEMESGVVLSTFAYKGRSQYVLSKSGGFGPEDLLVRLAEKITEKSG